MIDFLRKILGQKTLNYYHLACAILANFIYGFPSRKLHVIGVTGTDGKTTTVNMIASVLRAAGFPTAHLSTVNAQIGEQIYDTGLHTTTPSSFLLQKLIHRAVREGAQYFVLETTSHALDQYRTFGIKFETAVITNVSHEHLDYHKDLQSYMAAKGRLFRNVEYGILNRDDESYGFFEGAARNGKVITYGLIHTSKVWADDIQESLTTTNFIAHTSAQSFPVALDLPGRFNVYNALAAMAVAVNYNVSPDAIQRGLKRVKGIPGRMEFIEGNKLVLVDFAHTPNAIENLLAFLRPKIRGKIIHVFGSAGERDVAKRPLMGQASDRYADIIIITREDNRSESVEQISAEITKGIKGKQRDKEYFIIPDRRSAIRAALRLVRQSSESPRAEPRWRQAQGSNDLVVITGKGHEQSLNVDGTEMPWEDARVIREELGIKN